jgi:hypothetical protein
VDAIDEIVVGISVLLDSDEFDVKYKGLLGGRTAIAFVGRV